MIRDSDLTLLSVRVGQLAGCLSDLVGWVDFPDSRPLSHDWLESYKERLWELSRGVDALRDDLPKLAKLLEKAEPAGREFATLICERPTLSAVHVESWPVAAHRRKYDELVQLSDELRRLSEELADRAEAARHRLRLSQGAAEMVPESQDADGSREPQSAQESGQTKNDGDSRCPADLLQLFAELSPDGAQTMKLAKILSDSSKNTNDRMAEASKLCPDLYLKKSPWWAAVFDVKPQSITKTDYWKRIRRDALQRAKELQEERYGENGID